MLDSEIYLDGLIQREILDRVGKDAFKINKKWYKEAVKYIPMVQKEYVNSPSIDQFNIAMGKAMLDRFNNVMSDDEMEKYTTILVQSLAAAGVYEVIFGKEWEKLFDEHHK